MRIVLIAPFLLLATPALAQERSKTLIAVVDCRKIADNDTRLACFDKAVAELDTAERTRQVVVVDKEQVTEARRSVFGLTLPRIRLFAGDGEKDDISEIESTIVAVDRRSDGRIAFTLQDGAHWVQTDDRAVVGVRPGSKVTLKRAALGSFFAKFHGAISARVARIN